MNDLVLDLEFLRKTYPGKVPVNALNGISLQVPRGSIFGLIGPNGAGKSTLIKSLLSILKPTECKGTLLGEAIGHRPTLERVGYLPEHIRFPEYLTGRQIIEYAAGLSRLSRKSIAHRINALLAEVDMLPHADRCFSSYSKGMKQRIGLAQALIHEPEVIFLDEPTDGIDPEGRRDFRDIIVGLRDGGRTVFVNSHLLPEVEKMADRIAILYQGNILLSGAVCELSGDEWHYEISHQNPLPTSLMTWCQEQNFTSHEHKLTVRVEHAMALQPVIDRLRAGDLIITSIHEHRLSLEELYLQAIDQARGQNRQALTLNVPQK